jgi:hypothetical protein
MAYHFDLLNEDTMLQLQNMLSEHNVYYRVFKTAKERLAQSPYLQLCLKTIESTEALAARLDLRRYNKPVASEVAVIIEADDHDIQSGEQGVRRSRDIILEMRSDKLKRISDLHSAYSPLRYPLLFPRGEQGWHLGFQVGLQIRCSVVYLHLLTDDV